MNQEKRRKSGLIYLIVIALWLISIPAGKYLLGLLDSRHSRYPDDHNEIPAFPIDLARGYSISTSTKESSQVAEQILKSGGNAVDAAIAVSFALGVSAPQNGGIGGGGVVLVYDPEEQTAYFYDYYNSSGYESSNYNIGIPGFLRGMEALYNDYATLALSEIINPAISLAQNGISVNADLANILSRRSYITEFNENFLKGSSVLKKGDLLIQDDLADTYREILEQGFGVLYDGVSDMSMNLMKTSGLSARSLQDYQVEKFNAMTTDFMGYTIFGAASGFSSLTAIQMLKMMSLSQIDWSTSMTDAEIVDYLKIYNLALSDSIKHIGSRNHDIELYNSLVSQDYILSLMESNSVEVQPDLIEHFNTTSFTIIDGNGMVVVGTHTLSNYWGSTRSENGFFYNNSLKNFSNSEENAYEPMKRPKTYMAPLIFVSDNKIIAIGAAGGFAIPQVISQIMSRYLLSNQKFSDIVAMQRFAKYRSTLEIEAKNLRSQTIFEAYPVSVDYTIVKLDDKLGFIALSALEEHHYSAYYETTWCDESCVISVNLED